jgi:hypothetical protein
LSNSSAELLIRVIERFSSTEITPADTPRQHRFDEGAAAFELAVRRNQRGRVCSP